MKLKVYVIRYTTGDKWEFCQGIKFAVAKSKARAIKMVEADIKGDKITSTKFFCSTTAKKEIIAFSQAPQIE